MYLGANYTHTEIYIQRQSKRERERAMQRPDAHLGYKRLYLGESVLFLAQVYLLLVLGFHNLLKLLLKLPGRIQTVLGCI